MTKAAKQFGKQLINFWSNASTSDYMIALVDSIDIHSNSNEFSNRGDHVGYARDYLTYSERGRNGGTWAHPKLAVFFARWLDVRFAVVFDQRVDDILRGNLIEMIVAIGYGSNYRLNTPKKSLFNFELWCLDLSYFCRIQLRSCSPESI